MSEEAEGAVEVNKEIYPVINFATSTVTSTNLATVLTGLYKKSSPAWFLVPPSYMTLQTLAGWRPCYPLWTFTTTINPKEDMLSFILEMLRTMAPSTFPVPPPIPNLKMSKVPLRQMHLAVVPSSSTNLTATSQFGTSYSKNKSTVKVFSNASLLKNIRQSRSTLRLSYNYGTFTITLVR